MDTTVCRTTRTGIRVTNFRGLIFHGSHSTVKNTKITPPRKIPAIQYFTMHKENKGNLVNLRQASSLSGYTISSSSNRNIVCLLECRSHHVSCIMYLLGIFNLKPANDKDGGCHTGHDTTVEKVSTGQTYTVVSRKYAPPFTTLALV